KADACDGQCDPPKPSRRAQIHALLPPDMPGQAMRMKDRNDAGRNKCAERPLLIPGDCVFKEIPARERAAFRAAGFQRHAAKVVAADVARPVKIDLGRQIPSAPARPEQVPGKRIVIVAAVTHVTSPEASPLWTVEIHKTQKATWRLRSSRPCPV